MENEKKKSGIAKWIILACVLIVAVIVGILVYLNSQKLSATTMRLLKIQGIVKLFDKDKEKTITDNLRLANGNVITTESESLASIALDDTKIVTVNDNSRAEFLQDGKKLNINLTAGSLFFNVTEKLAADESFDIRTSNMVVGIRGTSGLVCVDENGHEVLYITDGEVEVVGTNPVTKEQKTATVKAGQKITIYLYNDKEKDSIMFELEPVADVDLLQLIKDRLLEDEELLKRVCAATGWNEDVIRGLSYDQSGQEDESSDTETTETQDSGTGTGETENTEGQGEGEGDGASDTGQGDTGQGDGDQNADEAGEEKPTTDNANANTSQPQSLMDTVVVGKNPENGNLILNDLTEFDPEFYYNNNEDVARLVGHDYEDLLEHYLNNGRTEGRAGTSQQAENTQQKNQEAWEEWQDTLDRLAQEEEERKYLEEQQRLAAEAAEYQANNGGGDDSGNNQSSGPRYSLVDGVWVDENGNEVTDEETLNQLWDDYENNQDSGNGNGTGGP